MVVTITRRNVREWISLHAVMMVEMAARGVTLPPLSHDDLLVMFMGSKHLIEERHKRRMAQTINALIRRREVPSTAVA